MPPEGELAAFVKEQLLERSEIQVGEVVHVEAAVGLGEVRHAVLLHAVHQQAGSFERVAARAVISRLCGGVAWR